MLPSHGWLVKINSTSNSIFVKMERAHSLEVVAHVPVRCPGTRDSFIYAMVDWDQEHVTRGYKWRLTTKGHVIASHKKAVVYLHKLVAGGSATHCNGNRLDNRRSNLKPIGSRAEVPVKFFPEVSVDQASSDSESILDPIVPISPIHK